MKFKDLSQDKQAVINKVVNEALSRTHFEEGGGYEINKRDFFEIAMSHKEIKKSKKQNSLIYIAGDLLERKASERSLYESRAYSERQKKEKEKELRKDAELHGKSRGLALIYTVQDYMINNTDLSGKDWSKKRLNSADVIRSIYEKRYGNEPSSIKNAKYELSKIYPGGITHIEGLNGTTYSDIANELDKHIRSHGASGPTLYRGIGKAEFEKWAAGLNSEYQIERRVSFSSNPKVAAFFSENQGGWTIILEGGAHSLSVPEVYQQNPESEYLIPTGARFHIVSVNRDAKEIHARYIGM